MPYITPRLKRFERKETSQFEEDGVIERIALDLGIERGTYFEFGIGPADGTPYDMGLEGNFVALKKRGWTGVFLDGNEYPGLEVRREFVTALNINQLYRKHALPDDLDFMSIDVDGQEFWIWMALIPRPKVVVIEYNGGLGPDRSVTMQFDVASAWDGTVYHGASLRALDKLAAAKNYVLAYSNGVNAIFIRDDLVSNRDDFSFGDIFVAYPPHAPDEKNRPWVSI